MTVFQTLSWWFPFDAIILLRISRCSYTRIFYSVYWCDHPVPWQLQLYIRMQRWRSTQHAMLQSSTCRFFSAAIDQLHLTIEIIIGPSTPYPILVMVPVVVVLWCVLPPLQLQARNLFFCCWSSLSIGSILCNPISPQIRSQPHYITRVLSCPSALRSAFRQSGMLQFDMVQSYCFVLSMMYFGFWRRWRRWLWYLDPKKCPTMRLYAQDGCVLKNSWFFNESGVSSIWNLSYMGISTAAVKK